MIRNLVRPREKGQALPLTVLFLFVLLGVVSLVVDAGMAYTYRRYMQNAADAAVLAGGAVIAKGVINDAQIVSTATYYAVANKANSITITYLDAGGNSLGQAGTGVVPAGAQGLKIVAYYQYTPGFAGVVGIGAFNISAEAKGSLRLGGGNAVILTLGTATCPGLDFSGSGSITADGGGVQVNSSCSSALSFNGSGEIGVTGPGLYATRSGGIFVAGGVRKVGSGEIQPTPLTGVSPLPDPLAGVVPPNIGSYPVRNGTATVPSTLSISGSSSRTLDPGVYYGGISMTGSGLLTLRPGIYIIAGGTLNLGGSGHIVADGVFFYLTNDPTNPSGAGAYSGLNLSGQRQHAPYADEQRPLPQPYLLPGSQQHQREYHLRQRRSRLRHMLLSTLQADHERQRDDGRQSPIDCGQHQVHGQRGYDLHLRYRLFLWHAGADHYRVAAKTEQRRQRFIAHQADAPTTLVAPVS